MPENTELPLILASASPRRRDLLSRENVRFEIIPADIVEVPGAGESPVALAGRLAAEKALAVARRVGPDPPRWILGADTIVVIDDEILGKPRDTAHAERLLAQLVGRTHSVITAFALTCSDTCEPHGDWIESRVTMRAASTEEIQSYVATGEPMDKAGAYALQGLGGALVEKVVGSRDNVIGLPVENVLARWADLRGAR